MERKLSFKTKLQRSHSYVCLSKKEFLETEKRVLNHRFDTIYTDLMLRNDIQNKINDLNNRMGTVKMEYDNIVKSVSPGRGLLDGIDFSRGKKMKLYENLFKILDEKLNVYNNILKELGDIDRAFEIHTIRMTSFNKKVFGQCKGQLHRWCKCPNVVSSCKAEECEICYENNGILFDLRCGNKHMICYKCIMGVMKDEKRSCPFCREKLDLSAGELRSFGSIHEMSDCLDGVVSD